MATTYIEGKYDIGITRADGSVVGMMLVQDQKTGVPKWQMFDDEYLASQFFTGTPGYGSLPAEKELAIIGESWRAGMGLDVYDANDPERYYTSDGMDMRFRGMAIAGPTPTTITKPSTIPIPTIVNANMEATSAPYGWTAYGAKSTVEEKTGAQSWLIDESNGAYEVRAYQDLTGDWVRGVEYTITGHVWPSAAIDNDNGVKIGIDDGKTETLSGYNTGNSDWEELTVDHTIAIDATRFRLILYVNSGGGATRYSYFDDIVVTSSDSLTVGVSACSADFNDIHYKSFGTLLAKENAAGTAFTAVAELGATITDLETYSDDKLYIAQGLAAAYYYMSTTQVLVESSGRAAENFKYFCFVHTTADTMYGSDAVNKIRSCITPENGGGTDWGGQTTVGSSYYEITKLLEKSGALYIMKEDMPYYLDSDSAVQNDLAPRLATETKSTDNGKNAIIWKNKLYMPWGEQVLLEYDAGTNTYRNPSDYCTDLSAFNGQVFAVAGDGRYLYAVLDYDTEVSVLAGRLETIGTTTSWVWHPIAEITLDGCETAVVTSDFQKRLYITSTLATDDAYYIPLPTGYGDIINDANRLFKTGVTMETPWLHGNFKGTNKQFLELELVMGHTYDKDIYFTVEYKKLGDTSWTTIGNYTGSSTSMTQSRFIPDDISANHPVATLLRLRFTAVTDDTDYTPILLSYHLKGILRPDQREIIACQVRCADYMVLKDGIEPVNFDSATIIETLDEARTATWPVTIYDIKGETQTVNFLPVSPRWSITKWEKGREEERVYNLLLQITPTD